MYEWTGGRISEVRKSKGMSGRELAKQVGITQTTLSHYETGKTIPPYDVFFNIANALGEKDIRWLAGFSDHKENSFEHIASLVWGNEELEKSKKRGCSAGKEKLYRHCNEPLKITERKGTESCTKKDIAFITPFQGRRA